jgi:hypothetical protein
MNYITTGWGYVQQGYRTGVRTMNGMQQNYSSTVRSLF